MYLLSRAPRLGVIVLGSLLALPAARQARAQDGPPRSTVVEFRRDGGDGYADARIDVRYQFKNCVGTIRAVYAMDRESIRVSGTYYYRGKSYQVPSSIGAPRPSVIDFSGPVLDAVGRIVGSFSDPYTQGGAGAGCLGQTQDILEVKARFGERPDKAQVAEFIASLWIQPRVQPRLRNGAVESWIGAQLAKEREDSLARLAEREKRDRDARARRDSLERADRDLAERRRRAEDSTSAANRRNADDQRTQEEREEREERDRAREQEAADREAKRRSDQSVADQTARLNAMWAVEKLEWERAEEAYARGDMATARPLYEKLAGSLVYGQQAQARLDALNSQQIAEGVVATITLLNQLREAVSNALHGTDLAVGGTYAQNGFPGAKGEAGVTFGYAAHPMQRWVPYFDFTFGLGNDESKAERYYPNKSYGGVVVGTTVPRLKLALGNKASLSPHFGWRWTVTDLRDVHVGQTGLTLIVPGAMVRADAVIINGKPQLGGAISRIF